MIKYLEKVMSLEKVLLIVVLLFINCWIVNASEYELKENFQITFQSTENVSEQFIMNIKEIDDGFLALKYELSGGQEIVKFNSSGEEVYTKSFDDVLLSDVIQTSSGKVLVTADEQKIFIYNPLDDTFSSLDTESVGHPSGHSIFEMNGNYIVVGAIKAKSNDTEYTIVLQLFDENGEELESNKIVQAVHPKCQSYSNDGAAISGTLCGSYYGAYSDGEVLYLLGSDGEDIVVLEIQDDLTYTKNVLSTSLSAEELLQITRGAYTELVRDDENLYFATTYGIYRIDKDNVLTQPIVAVDVNLDFTSIIVKNDYIIAGGIEKSQTNPRAWVTVFDSDFQIIKSINIHDYFQIEPSEKLSIVKGLTTTKNGFIVGGMLSSTPVAIEFSTKYKITTKTDGNGEVTSSLIESYVNENVQFTVQPNDGYKLDKVNVTDSFGNTISFESDTFVMPNADVVIEAMFVKENIVEEVLTNPQTSDIIIPIVVILLISICILLKYCKKMFVN